jgi:2-phosphoglycerate kinase
MLREVMRLMIPERLIPSLHTSSYLAWETLPEVNGHGDNEPRFVSGYLTQSEHVAVGIEGVLHRADREQVSMIIEGVHVHPALQSQLQKDSGTLVVPLLVAVLKEKQLKKRLKGRGLQIESRRSARYLEHFDSIWRLQSFLLSEADRFDIPIIVNEDIESAVTSIMTTIVDQLSTVFSGGLKGLVD